MKRNLLIILLLIGIIFQACQDDGDNDHLNKNPVEENKEYDLPVPEITISNPVPLFS
jgi:hypothetical protein